jgi:hypothetical protein
VTMTMIVTMKTEKNQIVDVDERRKYRETFWQRMTETKKCIVVDQEEQGLFEAVSSKLLHFLLTT